MEYIYIFAGVVIIWAIFEVTRQNKNSLRKNNKYKYIAKKDIMTNAEKQFYKKLQEVCGDDILIFPQVHLSTIFDHKVKGQNWKGAFSKINQKSVDYLLCRKDNLKPILAIELDDISHIRKDRIMRDEFVNFLFTESQINLLRIKSTDIKLVFLKNEILQCVHDNLKL